MAMTDRKPRGGLDGVADGVAEIEDAPQPALALVLLNDLGLDPAAGQDGVLDSGGLEGQDLLPLRLKESEKRRDRG